MEGKKGNETHVWCSEVDPGRWKRNGDGDGGRMGGSIGRNCVPWKSAVRVMEVVVMMMMMMMMIVVVVVVVVVVMIVTMTKTMSVDNDSAYGKDYGYNDGDVNEKWLLLVFDCQSESRYMCKRVGLCIMLVHGLWLCISKTRNGVLDRF